MTDRVYASLFYIAVIAGGAWTAVTIGEALTRQALTQLALIPGANSKPSRVDTVLAARDQQSNSPNSKERLIPADPSLPAGTLAKAMDEAEQSRSIAEDTTGEAAPVVAIPEAEKPRVAGWSKRLPKRAVSSVIPEETSGRLIVRSLRAEM